MKAFMLAAGNGTRLRPLTDRTPKCLVAIQSVPLLSIWLGLCRRHGIDEVLINTHSHVDVLTTYLKEGTQTPKALIAREEVLLGSAGTLLRNRAWVESESEFWILYGDVLTNVDLTRMLDFHRRLKQLATIGVYEVANASECGIATLDDQQIVHEFVDKPRIPAGNLAFAGVMLASPAIFDLIPRLPIPADIGFHVLPKLVGRMAAYVISEYLVDIGTPASYHNAQLTWPGLMPAAQTQTES